MDVVISLLVLSTLPHLVRPAVPLLTFGAVVEIMSGDSTVFSGETVQLRCSIPNNYRFTWRYLWFRGSEQLPQNGENIVLWKTNIKESGKYYCQGVRSSAVGKMYTLKSVPAEINVDGGWAILQVPPHPGLVGDTLTVTCRVRGNPPIHQVILYKDGVEVLRQKGLSPHVYLTDLTLEDQGLYSCRASWDAVRRTVSVISSPTPVQVLEVLTQPIIEIVDDSPRNPTNMMKLVCHIQYNGQDPASPIHYYFYKNDNGLGTATSQNYVLVTRTPGMFRCRATVPYMGVSRWSDPKGFGQVTGARTMKPPSLQSNDPLTLASTVRTTDINFSPTFEPTVARSSTQPPTAAPTHSQPPTTDSTHSSEPPLMASQPTPTTPLPADLSNNQSEAASGEADDMSGNSPDAVL